MARTKRDGFSGSTRDSGGPRLYRQERRRQVRESNKAARREARAEVEAATADARSPGDDE